MIGHGVVLGLITLPASRKAITPLPTTRIHGIVPVKKKSKAFPPLPLSPSSDTRIQLKNVPKIRKPRPPPTRSQSDGLNLLRSTRRNGSPSVLTACGPPLASGERRMGRAVGCLVVDGH